MPADDAPINLSLRRAARLNGPRLVHDAGQSSPLPVDQDGGRVVLWGERLTTFVNESNAARACAALSVLVDLGLLTPKGVVRTMLRASVDDLDPPPFKPAA